MKQPGTGMISSMRIDAFRNSTIQKLREWAVYVSVTDKPSHEEIVRDCIYVICEKRMVQGQLITPELQWLISRQLNLPERKKRESRGI